MESAGHVVLDLPYQGDGVWASLAILSILVIFGSLLSARRRRNAGEPVDFRAVLARCTVFFVFCAIALFQLVTHHH